MSADPLARLLGFDPSLEPGEIREVEVERVVEKVVEVERAPVETSYEGRLRADPRAVLVAALGVIFERSRDAKPHGPLGACREAVFWALKEVAHRNRDRIGPGWIIGKRDDPQT